MRGVSCNHSRGTRVALQKGFGTAEVMSSLLRREVLSVAEELVLPMEAVGLQLQGGETKLAAVISPQHPGSCVNAFAGVKPA